MNAGARETVTRFAGALAGFGVTFGATLVATFAGAIGALVCLAVATGSGASLSAVGVTEETSSGRPSCAPVRAR